MPRAVVLIACLLAIAAALSTWFWWPRDVHVPGYRDATNERRDRDPGANDPEPAGPRAANGATNRTQADPHRDLKLPSATNKLRVQLHGLHAQKPWTGPLQIELSDRGRGRVFGDFSGSADVDEQGRCELPLPQFWQPGMRIKIRIEGTSDGYLPLSHREQGNLQLDQTLALDVHAVAAVTGRVTDSRSEPVANARITAFRMQVGQPLGKPVGATGTDQDGAYRLQAPPDVPLMLIATAMQPSVMRWRGSDGITDNGQLRGDLLPANLQVQLSMLHDGSQCNFALADAARIEGIVTWPDGQPCRGARVRFASGEGNPLELSANATIQWLPDGTLATAGIAAVDRNGRFVVPAAAGAQVGLRVVDADNTLIVGDLLRYDVVAPIEQTITLPFPVTLRAVQRGQLVPYARMLMHGLPPQRAAADGTLRVVFATTTMVRAERGALRSPWMPVSSSQLDQTIDLAMVNELSALHVEFDAEFPIRNAAFHWKCEDGRRQVERLHRGDGSGPFEVWLEPGKYDLRITATRGERNGTFLLPIERSFRIQAGSGTEPALRLDLPAKFGGKFKLQVLDENSQYLGGKIVAIDVRGNEHTLRMSGGKEPGSFPAELTTSVDNLEPGPYELVIDLGPRGVHRRYVTIKKREIAPASLRL